MEGIYIAYVENLVNDGSYPIAPRTSMTDGTIVGISYQDSVITKSDQYQPLCRIHFFKTYLDTICIKKVVDVVNSNYERIITQIEDNCAFWQTTGVSVLHQIKNVRIAPNPFHSETAISFYNPDRRAFQMEITDINGRLVQRFSDITDNEIRFRRNGLANGVYFFRLWGEKGFANGKLILQ